MNSMHCVNYVTRKHLSRRLLLRGAGTMLALPLLESMLPALARAQAATPQSRLACIYVAHGAVMNRWMPATDGTGFEFTPTLKSLEPFRDQLNIISDTRLPLAYGDDASAGANHARSSQVWLTCAAPGTGPSPTSLDQVAAQHIGQDTPLPSLELSLDEGSSISYRTPTTPLPMELNPQVVFERLFGDGSNAAEREARTDLKGMLFRSGKPGQFIAGADLMVQSAGLMSWASSPIRSSPLMRAALIVRLFWPRSVVRAIYAPTRITLFRTVTLMGPFI